MLDLSNLIPSEWVDGIGGPVDGGSYTNGPKGFTVPAWLAVERDQHVDKFAWAVAHKPGATPINGGWNRRVAERARRIRAAVARDLDGNGRKGQIIAYGRFTPPGLLALPKDAAA